jgi:hypothetical protein
MHEAFLKIRRARQKPVKQKVKSRASSGSMMIDDDDSLVSTKHQSSADSFDKVSALALVEK